MAADRESALRSNVTRVGGDLAGLDTTELERRAAEIRQRMRPLEEDLAGLRAERDLLLTELRRRERGEHRAARADLKAAMKEGRYPTLAELVAGAESGSFEEFEYNLKTGGQVKIGFPGARAQTLTFTDGVKTAQASDLERAGQLYAAGWELGTPGRPGVRVHFPGTRQERVVPANDLYARPSNLGRG